MELDGKEALSLLERVAGIQNALIGFFKEKGYLDEADFVRFCNEIKYEAVKKEIVRGESAARSVKDEMHPGGEKATLALCEMAGLKKTDCVLDAGTGHGGAARSIVQYYGNTVIGLEADYVRLINAIFRTKQAGLASSISFCSGDAYHMPFTEEAFDVVLRQHAVYGQQEELFVKECFRVLNPGGRIAFQGILKRMSLSQNKCNMEDYSVDEYIRMLLKCGFENILLETEISNKEFMDSVEKTNSLLYHLAKKGIVTGIKLTASKK